MEEVRLIKQLIHDEDVKLHPYKDTKGFLTIGVGRNLTVDGISYDEAMILLKDDIESSTHDLDVNIPWWTQLDDVRQRVLADMCFNMGIEGLLGFHKMLNYARTGEYDLAADEMANSEWNEEVKERARMLEQMMRTGKDV